jgi:GT2 family glycosyltransferase/glycosyltransferase involved in cell wall biosynthesis
MASQQETYRDTEVVKREQSPAGCPRLSVILCTYNRCNLVLSTLASLRRQTLPYHQFEVIVVDNGSTDGTLKAVRTYVQAGMQDNKKPEDCWRVHCLSEPQNGLAYARNTGLLAASGEIAVFVDDDTIADPHFLERLLTAYEETGADAIGGRVEIRWEAPRPHWLSDELLGLLGYFAPSPVRVQLKAPDSFSNSNFSVKIEALRGIDHFSPLLSKRLDMPVHMESYELCYGLYQAGYVVWYEPGAIVAHRVPAARLTRPFFVGRAYWQGRSEVLVQYLGIPVSETSPPSRALLRSGDIFHELCEIAYLALLQRPLLRLAGKSSNERLLAAMAQAESWGRLQQRLRLMEHVPVELTTPAVLFVRPAELDPAVDLLVQAFAQQDIDCSVAIANIPLSWLWRHRADGGQPAGIIHFHRPGAFNLTHQQRQQLLFRLWLACRWGIRIVTTDAGGWWQSAPDMRFFPQRSFERKIMQCSDLVVAHTRQPEQLYPDKNLQRRVRCLPHPGFRGYYAPAVPRTSARQHLGLPLEECFVYLCLVSLHTEQELVHLAEAFQAMPTQEALSPRRKLKRKETGRVPIYRARGAPLPNYAGNVHRPQLVFVGLPQDKNIAQRLFKFAALNSAIHLFLTSPTKEDIPLYLGAVDAVVLPHLPNQVAGTLEPALLALSYERVVIAPNLPRFRGMLSPKASILYEPASRWSLARALVKAQTCSPLEPTKGATACPGDRGVHGKCSGIPCRCQADWEEYAQRLLKLYEQLLKSV